MQKGVFAFKITRLFHLKIIVVIFEEQTLKKQFKIVYCSIFENYVIHEKFPHANSNSM